MRGTPPQESSEDTYRVTSPGPEEPYQYRAPTASRTPDTRRPAPAEGALPDLTASPSLVGSGSASQEVPAPFVPDRLGWLAEDQLRIGIHSSGRVAADQRASGVSRSAVPGTATVGATQPLWPARPGGPPEARTARVNWSVHGSSLSMSAATDMFAVPALPQGRRSPTGASVAAARPPRGRGSTDLAPHTEGQESEPCQDFISFVMHSLIAGTSEAGTGEPAAAGPSGERSTLPSLESLRPFSRQRGWESAATPLAARPPCGTTRYAAPCGERRGGSDAVEEGLGAAAGRPITVEWGMPKTREKLADSGPAPFDPNPVATRPLQEALPPSAPRREAAAPASTEILPEDTSSQASDDDEPHGSTSSAGIGRAAREEEPKHLAIDKPGTSQRPELEDAEPAPLQQEPTARRCSEPLALLLRRSSGPATAAVDSTAKQPLRSTSLARERRHSSSSAGAAPGVPKRRRLSDGSQEPESEAAERRTCSVDTCQAPLDNASRYSRRRKCCATCMTMTSVISGGVEKRYCQQCR